jgi:hypothetical protein
MKPELRFLEVKSILWKFRERLNRQNSKSTNFDGIQETCSLIQTMKSKTHIDSVSSLEHQNFRKKRNLKNQRRMN